MVDKYSAATSYKVLMGEASHQSGGGEAGKGGHYVIKVGGQLDKHWSEWLGNLNLTHDAQGNTLLVGAIPDQAALYGLLVQIHDLGLALISLNPREMETEEGVGSR